MPETDTTITDRLLAALVGQGVVTVEQVSLARDAGAKGGVGGALLERGLITRADVAAVLESQMGVPRVDLASYTPDAAALSLMPADVAKHHGMLPLFEIEGMLTVALGDAFDAFSLDGLARELGLEVEPVLAEKHDVKEAIEHYYGAGAEGLAETASVSGGIAEAEAFLRVDPLAAAEADAAAAAATAAALELLAASEDDLLSEERSIPGETHTPPPTAPIAESLEIADAEKAMAEGALDGVIAGEPQALADALGATEGGPYAGRIDLDVLAVADARAAALLVSDILEDAAARGATHVHLIPYKDDFFLVYRVGGRLEKAGSAPRSMQRPLVEGLRNFADVPRTIADSPVLGRTSARLGDADMDVTVSVVPTLAGQRVVVALSAAGREVPGLGALGLTEVEASALAQLMARGRGLVVVAAPAGQGASTTAAALLAAAASAGRTAYAVEREPGYDLPAVAQVVADAAPGSTAAVCLRAGLAQDTDVVALDGAANGEELSVALTAAARGRLAVVTIQAPDVIAALGRLQAFGADRESLAAVLTCVMAQRLVRTVCGSCAAEVASPLAVLVPGLGEGAVTRRGAGCEACGGTGVSGETAVFELLAVDSAVRAAIGRGDPAATVASVRATGCRPMVESSAALAAAGRVTPEEIDRVFRLSGA